MKKQARGFQRSDRVAEQVRRDLADLIRSELKDPRVGMISLTAVELFIVEVRHQVGFYVVDHFIQRGDKAVKIFFVEEDFVPFVTISIFPTGTFRNGDEVIVAPRLLYIEEVSAAFAGADALGKHAFLLFTFATVAAVAEITPVAESSPVATSEVAPVTKPASVAGISPPVAIVPPVPIIAPVAIVTPIAVVATVSIPKIPVVTPFKMPVFHLSELI